MDSFAVDLHQGRSAAATVAKIAGSGAARRLSCTITYILRGRSRIRHRAECGVLACREWLNWQCPMIRTSCVYCQAPGMSCVYAQHPRLTAPCISAMAPLVASASIWAHSIDHACGGMRCGSITHSSRTDNGGTTFATVGCDSVATGGPDRCAGSSRCDSLLWLRSCR